MDENRKKLYDQLSATYDMGTFDEFDTDLDNEDNQKVAWEAMGGQDGYGDFAMFQQAIARSPQAAEAETTGSAGNTGNAGSADATTMAAAAPMMEAQQPDWATTTSAMPGEDDADADISLPDAPNPNTPKDASAVSDGKTENRPDAVSDKEQSANAALYAEDYSTKSVEELYAGLGLENKEYSDEEFQNELRRSAERIGWISDPVVFEQRKAEFNNSLNELQRRMLVQRAAAQVEQMKPPLAHQEVMPGLDATTAQEIADARNKRFDYLLHGESGKQGSPYTRAVSTQSGWVRSNQLIEQARYKDKSELDEITDKALNAMSSDPSQRFGSDEEAAIQLAAAMAEEQAQANGGHAKTPSERELEAYYAGPEDTYVEVDGHHDPHEEQLVRQKDAAFRADVKRHQEGYTHGLRGYATDIEKDPLASADCPVYAIPRMVKGSVENELREKVEGRSFKGDQPGLSSMLAVLDALEANEYDRHLKNAIRIFGPERYEGYVLAWAKKYYTTIANARVAVDNMIRNEIINQLGLKPSNNWEYLFGSVLNNTFVTQGLKAIYGLEKGTRPDDFNYITAQQVAYKQYEDEHDNDWQDKLTQMAAPALTLVADAVTGGFFLAGKAAQLTSLLPRLFYASGEAASRSLMNSAIYRIFMGSLSGAANFATYEMQSIALQQLATGEYREKHNFWSSLGHAGVSGAAKGMVFGTVGEAFGSLFSGVSGKMVYGVEAGKLLAETATFSAMGYLENGNLTFKDVGTNFGLALSGRASHAGKLIKDIRSRANNDGIYGRKANYHKISEAEKDALVALGYGDVASALRGENISEPMLRRMQNQLEQMRLDKRVSWETIRCCDWVLNGRLNAVPGVRDKIIEADGKGGYTITAVDANGRAIMGSVHVTGTEARNKVLSSINHEIDKAGWVENESKMQSSLIGRQLVETVREYAESTGEDAEALLKTYMTALGKDFDHKSLEPVEKKVYETINALRSGKGQPTDIADTKETIGKRFGVDIDQAIKTEKSQRTKEQRAALAEYQEWLDGREDIIDLHQYRGPAIERPYYGPERGSFERKRELGDDEYTTEVEKWRGGVMLGKVVVVNSLDEVTDAKVRKQIEDGDAAGNKSVPGWYDSKTDTAYIYAPHIIDGKDFNETMLHEVVSHKGLRGLLGEADYNKLLDKIWEDMSPSERKAFEDYPGGEENESEVERTRRLADEWLAQRAQGVDVDGRNSIWQTAKRHVKDWLRRHGIDVYYSDYELENKLRESYRELAGKGRKTKAERGSEGEPRKEDPIFEGEPEHIHEDKPDDGAVPPNDGGTPPPEGVAAPPAAEGGETPPPVVELPVERPTSAVGRVEGTPADIEDWRELMTLDPDELDSSQVTEGLSLMEREREQAHRYANGELAEEPSNWEYWAARDGLSAPENPGANAGGATGVAPVAGGGRTLARPKARPAAPKRKGSQPRVKRNEPRHPEQPEQPEQVERPALSEKPLNELTAEELDGEITRLMEYFDGGGQDADGSLDRRLSELYAEQSRREEEVKEPRGPQLPERPQLSDADPANMSDADIAAEIETLSGYLNNPYTPYDRQLVERRHALYTEQDRRSERVAETPVEVLRGEFSEQIGKSKHGVELDETSIDDGEMELTGRIKVDGEDSNVVLVHGEGDTPDSHWNYASVTLPGKDYEELVRLAGEFNRIKGRDAAREDPDALRLNFTDIDDAIEFDRWTREHEQEAGYSVREGETFEEYDARVDNPYKPDSTAALYVKNKYADRWEEITRIVQGITPENAELVGRELSKIIERDDAGKVLSTVNRGHVNPLTILPFIDGVSKGLKDNSTQPASQPQESKAGPEHRSGEADAQVDEEAERRAAQEADPYYMPMENKGGGRMSPNYRKATAEQIFNHLNDRENASGRDTLDGNIADGVKRAEDKLKAVERREPKGKGRSDAALDKWEKELSEARAQLEKWREVERMRREQKAAEGDDSDPTWKQAYDAYTSSDEYPSSLEDYVARHLYGTKFKWKDKELERTGGRTHGLGGHLGLGKSEKERRGFFGWIDEKNGSYPESVAEGIHANMPDWMRDRYDTMEVLDAVLSVVGGNPRPRDMVVDYAKRLREQSRDMDEYYADEAAGARGFADAGEMDAYDNMREREATGFHDVAAAGREADGARADLLADARARLADPNASEFDKQAARAVLRFRQRDGRDGVTAQGTDGDGMRYRIRTKEPPKKTRKVYKLMRLGEDGKLYPLFIDSASPVELGTWYDADSPNLDFLKTLTAGVHLVNAEAGESMTLEQFSSEHPELKIRGSNPNAAAIDWATANGMRWMKVVSKDRGQRRYGGELRSYYNYGINGSGAVETYALRPGWHAGSLPTMRQIGKGPNKNLRDNRFVWVEGEVAADVDYQGEADANPDKDIPDRIPEDGYYLKATNADKAKSQADRVGWFVSGAFKANRIISDAEARRVIDQWNAEHPDQKVEYDYERESGVEFSEADAARVNGVKNEETYNWDNIKPIGQNRFGGIYDQFRGKAREAFYFLKSKKEGYLKGVFHRDDIGDIDLVWGDAPNDYNGKGLAHIIRKHIQKFGDFNDLDDAIATISDVINNGESYNNSRDARLVNIEKGDYRVVVAMDNEGNWVLSALDFVTPKKVKLQKKEGKTLPPSRTPGQSNDEAGAVTSNLSTGKDTASNSDVQAESAKTTENGGISFRVRDDERRPTFYSNAERAVENVKQGKATAEQWKAMLTKAGGIKAGEDKWMGLTDWLDEHKGQSLTKDEVLQFVRDNGIRMEEVNYGGDEQDRWRRIWDNLSWSELYDTAVRRIEERGGDSEEWDNINDEIQDILTERYGEQVFEHIDYDSEGNIELKGNEIHSIREDYTTPGLENKREIAFVVPGIEPYQENDAVHFGPENEGRAVMWVRFGETTDTDGKRVLVIDEVQSNRHQDARERGYITKEQKDADKALKEYISELKEKYGIRYYNQLSPQERLKFNQLTDSANDIARGGIPAAPFEKNWMEVAMKRMLRLAAEEGFDKVAWTTGKQQAERYDLGDVVKSIKATDGFPSGFKEIDIELNNDTGSTSSIRVAKNNGEIVRTGSTFTSDWKGKNLRDVVGKEMAERLLADGQVNIRGEALRIGGDGMKGFYDEMLPRFMNKYGKKWGAKVGEVELTTPGGEVMHSVDVTEPMRESVMQGQPLFRIRGEHETGDRVRVRREGMNDGCVRVEGLPGEWRNIDEAGRAMQLSDPEHMYVPSDDGKWLDVYDWRDNEVWDIWRGKPGSKRFEKWRERTLNHIHKQVPEYAKKLGLDVELIEDEAAVPAGHENEKSWYDAETGKIHIVVPRHAAFDVSDVMSSLWHEGVSRHGLRKLVGDDNYDTFLDNVYATSDANIRAEIDRLAEEVTDGDRRGATEEYLSRLAEQMGFQYYKDGSVPVSSWMQRGLKAMRENFDKLCRHLGMLDMTATLRDDDLRAVLYDSYHHLLAENRDAYAAAKRAEREDKEYVKAVKRGDIDTAMTMLHRKLATSEGIVGYAAPHGHGGSHREVSHRLKDSESGAIEQAARDMAQYVPKDAVLVPMPPHEGVVRKDTDTWLLAQELSRLTGAPVVAALRGRERESRYAAKQAGRKGLSADELGFYQDMELPGGKTPVFVDNVVGSGETAKAAVQAMGGKGMTLAYTKGNLGKPTEGLKNVTVTYDDAGNLIPLSERFDRSNSDVRFRVRDGRHGSDGIEGPRGEHSGHEAAVEEARRRLADAAASEFERQAARAVIKAYGGGSDDAPDTPGGGVRFRTRDDADMLVDMAKHNNEVARQRRDAVTDFVKAITDVDELTDSKFATALGKVMRGQRQYDQATVADITTMVKAMMDAGLLTELDNFSVKQILTKVKDSTGKNDITAEANKLIDIMLKHQLKKGKKELDKSLKVTGQRVDSRGVVVQAGLDPHGQLMVAAFKEGMKLDEQQLDEQIAKAQNDMSSSNQPLAADAAGRYDGLLLARQHLLDIRKSEADEVLLKNQLTEAKELHKAGMIDDATYKQLVESINDQLRDNKFERIEAYNNLQSALGYGVAQSVEASKQWRESNAKRVGEIQHNANSDLEGVSTSEFSDPSRWGRFANNIILRFLNSSLPTFDFMLRFFGSKNVRGEGYLFNRFMRGDNGYIKSSDRAARGEAEAMDVLSKKASELFGKKMRFVALGSLDRKLPKVSVEFLDGGEMKPHELTQGQVVYMYMVNKMADGRQKLRAMGITQEAVDSAVSHVDQRLVKLADWIQNVFNEQLHNKYNAVHQRVFGSPLTHIANYFPLRVNPRSRLVTVDNANDGADGNNRPSTITGGIIKRTRNNYALDLPHNSFVDVMQQHISEMEHWAAFAEFNRDINTLLSYKNFRNKVANMTSFRYGSGNRLLEKFEKVAALAGGGYRPAVKESSIDNIVTNIVKGLTVNKIAFRLHTALKQLESGIVYLSEANPADIMNNMLNLSGSWNWAIENLPGFTRRWVSRTSGDYRLRHSELDWKVFNQGFIEKLNRWGMTPNAFVDAMTVAVGARSIYDSRFAKHFKDYLDSGLSQEDAYAKAHDKALMDATASFNETQQSSEEAFVSTIQADRTVASAALTAFRNASMGYQRRLGQAYANLARRLRKGYKEQSIEFMTKQGIRDGLSADVAERAAKRAYRNGTFRDIADVALFGFFVQFGWNMMNNMYYQMFGDDDEEKKEARVDAAWHSLYGGQIEGLAGGNILSDLIHMKSTGQNVGSYNFALLPFVSDMQSMLRKTDGSNPRYIEAATDAINILIGSGTGVNPQVLTDVIVAGFDACDGDLVAFHETMWFLSRLLQVPQSEQKKFLVDRIGKEGADGKPLSLEQVASRYGRYVMRRNAPLGSLAYDGEQEIDLEKRYAKQIEDAARKRDERLNDEEFAQKLRELEDKGLDTKEYWKDFNKRAGVDSDYGKPDKDASAQARLYYDLKTYEDHAGDVAVRRRKAKVEEWGKGRKEKGLKRKGDKWHYAKDADRKAAKEYFDQHRSELEALAKIEYYESEVDKLKKKLVAEGADQKDIMRQIRELRNKILAATDELK